MRECNLPQEERHGGEEGSPKDRQESSSIDSNQERVIIGTGGRGGGSQGQRSKWHPCQRLLRGLEVQGQEAPRLLVSQEPQPQRVLGWVVVVVRGVLQGRFQRSKEE